MMALKKKQHKADQQLPDLKFIRSLIQKKLRLKKWTYKRLATELNVSEPTVKRWLSQSDISVLRLIQIGQLLDFSLVEISQTKLVISNQFDFYTPAQEEVFLKHPLGFYIFIKLAFGYSFSEVIRLTNISESEFRKHLLDLEKVGLIEVWPGDKTRIKLKGPYRLRAGKPLTKKINFQLKEAVVRHFDKTYQDRVALQESPNYTVFHPTELHLTAASAYQLSLDLMNTFAKYANLSAYEAQQKSKTEPVSILIGVDAYDAWAQFSIPTRKRK